MDPSQLFGFNAVRLIAMIVKAANTARLHKKNCRQFAQHLRPISNLLEQLKISELKRYPETREPLEQLEDALRRSYVLVNSCQDRSYLYLLAKGWNIVNQLKKARTEIEEYLRLVPLITLVDNNRARASAKEKLESIVTYEYTLDDEDRKTQDVILQPDSLENYTAALKKSLSCSYPNLPFEEALKKENEMLQLELERSLADNDVNQRIQHLIKVTEAVIAANSLPEKSSPEKNHNYSDANSEKEHSSDENHHKRSDSSVTSRNTSSVSSQHDLLSTRGPYPHEEYLSTDQSRGLQTRPKKFSAFHSSYSDKMKLIPDSNLLPTNNTRNPSEMVNPSGDQPEDKKGKRKRGTNIDPVGKKQKKENVEVEDLKEDANKSGHASGFTHSSLIQIYKEGISSSLNDVLNVAEWKIMQEAGVSSLSHILFKISSIVNALAFKTVNLNAPILDQAELVTPTTFELSSKLPMVECDLATEKSDKESQVQLLEKKLADAKNYEQTLKKELQEALGKLNNIIFK